MPGTLSKYRVGRIDSIPDVYLSLTEIERQFAAVIEALDEEPTLEEAEATLNAAAGGDSPVEGDILLRGASGWEFGPIPSSNGSGPSVVDFSDLTGEIADEQVPTSPVKQHETALAIAWAQLTGVPAEFPPSAHGHPASQITTGTFGAGDYTFPDRVFLPDGSAGEPSLSFASDTDLGIYKFFSNFLGVEGSLLVQTDVRDEILRLVANSPIGNPFLSFYQEGTRRALLQYEDSGDQFRIRTEPPATGGFEWTFKNDGYFQVEDGGIILEGGSVTNLALFFSSDTDLGFYKVTTGGMGLSASFFALNHPSGTGSPYISWRQNGTQKGFIQYEDTLDLFRIVGDGAVVAIHGGGDEALRLRTNSGTGSPFLSFYQAGTRAAFIQYSDSTETFIVRSDVGSLRLQADIGEIEFRTAGVKAATLASGGDFTPEGQFLAQSSLGFSFNNDTDTGLTLIAANTMNLMAGGDDVVQIRHDAGSTFMVRIRGDRDELLRLRRDSDTGNPFLSFYQAATRRALIQYVNSGERFRILAQEAGSSIEFYTANTKAAVISSGGDITAEGDVIATVP